MSTSTKPTATDNATSALAREIRATGVYITELRCRLAAADAATAAVAELRTYLATADPAKKTATQVLADVDALLPAAPEPPARTTAGAPPHMNEEKQS